jgi:hypothetical protein
MTENPLSGIDLIASTGGLFDDVLGTVTGSSYGNITRPDWVVKLLTCTWSGTAWAVSTDWDFTTLAATCATAYNGNKFPRALLGFQDPPVTLRDAIEAVCRDSVSRVGVDNSGKLFVQPWGGEYTPALIVPPQDLEPLDYSIGDVSTLINKVSVAYGKNDQDLKLERNRKSKTNYNGTLNQWAPIPGVFQKNTTNSRSLYGQREFAVTESEYIGDSATAETVAEANFIRYSKPLCQASFLLPYAKYKTLKLLDVILFWHPAYPNFFRSNTHGQEPCDTGSGANRTGMKCNRYYIEGNLIRAQVEGRYVVKQKGQAPRLRIVTRVLQSFPEDPT